MKWILKLTGKHLWSVAALCLFVITLTLADVVQALAMANFLDFAAAGDKAGFLLPPKRLCRKMSSFYMTKPIF